MREGASKSEVYAIVNAEPEIQAYGLAKFSRSAKSCKKAIVELTSEDASEFFKKYFGHKSIADLGHLAIAVENVSQWMADELELPWDGPWDGQERSTRYQDFSKREVYWPWPEGRAILDQLFDLYDEVLEEMRHYYRRRQGADSSYSKTINSRSFDVARYCLPMATLTSIGQVVSIRTLEKQICRLFSSEFLEVRGEAEKLKAVCSQPAVCNVLRTKLLQAKTMDLLPSWLSEGEKARLENGFKQIMRLMINLTREGVLEHILSPIKPASTLARYLAKNRHLIAVREVLRKRAAWYLLPLKPVLGAQKTRVDCCWRFSNLPPYEQTIAAALYWQAEGHYLSEVVRIVQGLSEPAKRDIFDACRELRGEHDEALPLFRAGYRYAVEFALDNGADRDMKRHRRCVQIPQRPTTKTGFAVPQPLKDKSLAKLRKKYIKALTEIQQEIRQLEKTQGWEAAVYALPLAQIRQRLFLMDLAEVDYIVRLRTKPGGHFAYRQGVYDLYRQVVAHDPRLKNFLYAVNPADDEE